jgi:hypothetical protein
VADAFLPHSHHDREMVRKAVFGELDGLAKGTNQKISPTDELRRGLDRELREREASRRRAAGLGRPGGCEPAS